MHESAKHTPFFENLLSFCLVSLVIYSSIFAAIEDFWASSFIILFGGIILLILLVSAFRKREISVELDWFNFFCSILFGVLFCTLLPIPQSVLKLFAPETLEIYRSYLPGFFKQEIFFPWHAISLYPQKSLFSFFLLFTYVLVFFSFRHKFNNLKARIFLGKMIVGISFVIACWGLVNMHIQNKKLFWFREIITGIPTGPFINTIHFGGVMAFCIPLTLGFWVANSNFNHTIVLGNRFRFTHFFVQFFGNFLVYLFPAIIMTIALFKSLSRGAMIAFCGSIFTFSVLLFMKQKTRAKSIIVFFVSLVLLFGIFSLKNSQVQSRINTLKSPLTTDSAQTRLSVWRDTLKMSLDFPLFGTGLNTFSAIFLKYKTICGSAKALFSHAENDFIELLAETGFLGMVVFLSLAILFMFRVFKNYKDAKDSFESIFLAAALSSCFAIFICALSDFVFHIPSICMIFVVMCFIVWPQNLKKNKIIISCNNNKSIFIWVFLIGVFVCFLMCFVSLKTLFGQLYFYKFTRNKIDFSAKVDSLKTAIFFDRTNSDYWFRLGKIYYEEAAIFKGKNDQISIALIKKAKDSFERASVCFPAQWRYHFYNGKAEHILAAYGQKGFSFRNAERYLVNAVELNSSEYALYQYLGDYYLSSQPDHAQYYYRKLLTLRSYFLGSVLAKLWAVSKNYRFIRGGIPDDPFLLLEYARFLESKNAMNEAVYEEIKKITMMSSFRTKLSVAEKLFLLRKTRDAVDCLYDAVRSTQYFREQSNDFSIPQSSVEELLELEQNTRSLESKQIDNPEIIYKFALFYYQIQEYNRALNYFDILTKKAPQSVFLLYKRSLVLFHLGRYDEAFSVLKNIISVISSKEKSREFSF